MTRYLAKEPGARGITANVVAPGAIETDFSGGMVRDNPEVNKQVAAMTALGRAGLPVGPMIAALLSDDTAGERQRVSKSPAGWCRDARADYFDQGGTTPFTRA